MTGQRDSVHGAHPADQQDSRLEGAQTLASLSLLPVRPASSMSARTFSILRPSYCLRSEGHVATARAT